MALREANQEVFTEWFEANEVAYQYALIWQTNGLVRLEILNQYQIDEILDSERFNNRSEAVQEDIEMLLTGGFSLVNEFGSQRFLNTVSTINLILRDLEIDINIRNAWFELIGNE